MPIDVLSWRDLGERDRAAWAEFRAANPALRSPYFDLGWFDAVNAARGDLKVVRATRDGRAEAFLAFHFSANGLARPAGANFCDWHGAVAAPGARLDPGFLALGPPAFRFDCAPADDPALAGFATSTDLSHALDLSLGYELYARPPAGKAAPKAVANFRRGMRKLEADGRDVAFKVDDGDPQTFKTLFRLKSEQLQRSGHPDALAWDWSRRLIDALPKSRDGVFGFVLSSMSIDGVFAAGHLGLRSGGVVHHWLPAFDRALGNYAPGNLLSIEIARAAAADGVCEMDLGPGDYTWKREFANAHIPLIRGVATARSMSGRLAALVGQANRVVEAMPLGALSTAPRRAYFNIDRALLARARPPQPDVTSRP